MESTTTVISEKSRLSFPLTNIIAWALSTFTILGAIVYYTNVVTSYAVALKSSIDNNKLQQQLDQKANELRFQQNEHRLDKLESK